MATWDETKHPRDPQGESTGGQFTAAEGAARKAAGLDPKDAKAVFRGTSIEEARKAKKEGIKRVEASIGDRPPSVYFMNDKASVKEYVEELYSDQEEGFAIIEIFIPKDQIGKIKEDEEEGDSYRIEEDIPAEWVGRIWYYDAKGGYYGMG